MSSKETSINRNLNSRKRPSSRSATAIVEENFAFISKSERKKSSTNSMDDEMAETVPTANISECLDFSPYSPSSYSKGPDKNNGAYKKNSSFGGGAGSRKLVIKNFRKREVSNENLFELKWSILEESVLKIQNKQKASTSYEELYRIVENLCMSNFANDIYQHLNKVIGQYIEKNLYDLLDECATVSNEAFLQRLNKMWMKFCDQMGLVRSVFLYLDRTYVLQNSSILSLWDAGLETFRMIVLDNDNVRQRTVQGLLQLIEAERLGSNVDRQLLKSLLRMLTNLQIYHQIFEGEFLRNTEALYEVEARNKCQELDVGSYLRHVFKRLNEEEERVDYYLDYSTRKKLIQWIEKCFITDYVDTIIAKGSDVLLSENKVDELSLMYDLLSRSKNGLSSLKMAFASYIKKVGKSMIMDIDRDKTLVQDLMDLKEKLDNIVEKCFTNNEKFVQAERDAFDYFINTRPNKPAELIAKFMDTKLRAGNKECSDEELDNLMDKVIVLFRFIQGKDVFEAFYKKDLAKRLLLGRSASVDAEKSMLVKLKNECGSAFTQKLEGMFKDMEVSKELCATFKQYMEGGDRATYLSKTEFNVSVLTMGNWPNYSPMEVVIPCPLAEYQQHFAHFYSSKHNGRKLQWQYSLASAILKGTFKPGVVKELDVSLFQAMCLLIFNVNTEWSFEEILEHTKIEELELKRTLQSLACGKFRVILKNPRGKDVLAGDKFIFNSDFNNHLHRIRISQVQMKETEAEHRQTEEQVFQDRQYQIDAAIVRIMKMRKTLSHNLLISELFNQLRFPAKPVDLKKRIESLIEREYICRDKSDQQLYNYVA